MMAGEDNQTLEAILDCNDTMLLMSDEASPRNSSGHNHGLFLYRYIMNVGIMTPIVSLGIIANVIAFIVLCRQKQRLTTTVLLQGLAVADTLILVISLLRCIFISYTMGGDDGNNENATFVVMYRSCWRYTYMLMYFVRLTDTWLTILLTIDRYIAVCRPLQAQRICTLVRTYRHVTLVLVVSFLFSLPRFFEYKSMKQADAIMRSVEYLYAYRIGAFSLCMYLVPMTLLTVLNIKLLCELRRANRFREFVQHSTHSETQVPAAKKSVTVIVVTVVLVCIACNVTAFTSYFLWTLHVFARHEHLNTARRYASSLSNLMVALNSAVNFFIYCLCSRNFRTELVALFRCHLTSGTRKWRNHSSTGSLPVDTLMTQMSICTGCGNRDSTLTSRSLCQACRSSSIASNSLSRRV